MSRLYKKNPNGPWYADFVDQDGNRQRKSTGCNDKVSAKKILDKWTSVQKLMEFGVIQPERGDQAIKPHLRAFQTAMVAAGRNRNHIDRTAQLIQNVIDYGQWETMSQISADGLATYCQHMKKDQDQANRTVASVITALRTFCRWCVRNRVIDSDPTASVQKPSLKTDRRIERRMLLPDEWKWLKSTLIDQPTDRNGQSSAERLLMYWTAIETGLRASELMSLTKSALKMDDKDPHIIVKASITKNSKLAKQYVSDELAAMLRGATGRKTPGAKVFHMVARTEMARALVADMTDARAAWLKTPDGKKRRESDFLQARNADGETIDFHSLRHTCGAWLVQAGVTLAEVREIMRHSTITLTVDCYGHIAPDARSKSRSLLGAMLS